jgi:RNA polymerase sigma factor (sigma-70 family)
VEEIPRALTLQYAEVLTGQHGQFQQILNIGILFFPYKSRSETLAAAVVFICFSLFLQIMEEEVIRQQYSEKDKLNIFNQEFMPHINSMYNFAYRLTLDSDDAKDLLQDTYLKAFRFIDSFQQGTNAKAWLFRILKNSFINDYRKKSKEPSKVDYQEVETFYNSEDVDRQITPDLRVEALQDMIGDEISIALNSLDVDFRTVIILCDLEGFKYEEMAKILDIPIGTVRSRLHRARNLLKEKLSEYAKKMGYKNA